MEIVAFLFKWLHLLLGIAWIGLLYYFNFVQTEYFKEASPEGLADAKEKLAPRALAWFRWSAKFTFVTGAILLVGLGHQGVMNDFIILGSIMGTIMMVNVLAIIWPKQKIVLGLKEGDASVAAPKAALASRTNALLSGPMVFCMLASHQFGYHPDYLVSGGGLGLGLWLSVALVGLIEANAIAGKPGPIASIRGVIHMSILLTAVIYLLNLFL